jgi:Peptidase family M28
MEIPSCLVSGWWRLFFVLGWSLILPPVGQSAEMSMPRLVDPHRLEAHVRMLSETLTPRNAAHPNQLDRVASYVREEFGRAHATVVDQPFHVDGIPYRNVVARYGPETQECVVVGAHYDAAGPYPGADDNASGVAGLLELAAVLGKTSLPRTVELVAYPLEEPPFFGTAQMGSAIHAHALRHHGVKVRAMFSLEMIGYFTDAAETQNFPLPWLSWRYPSTGNFIAVVGKLGQGGLVRRVERAMAQASSLPVFSLTAPRSLSGVGLSDHVNYWQVGYPAVMITDTAFYRNPHYHTRTDTADTLDYRRMAQVVEGVYAAVQAMVK